MMTKEEWESLAGSSGWPKFKQYLTDCREGLKEAIARDRFPLDDLRTAVVECQLLKRHCEIEFRDIEKFYGAEEQEEDNES